MAHNDHYLRNAAGCFNNDFYRSIMEQARDIILVVAPGGRLIDANQAAVNAYGYSIEELRSMYVRDLRSAETRTAVEVQLKVAQQEGILFRTVHLRCNGETFPVEVSSRRVFTYEGEVVVSIVRDITAMVAAEKASRAQEEQLQSLYEELTASHEELLASDEELRQQFDEVLIQEEAIRRQNVMLKALHDTVRGLMHRHNTADLLKRIIAVATELVGTPHGFIWNLDVEKGVFRRNLGLGICESDIGREIPIDQGMVGAVYQTGEPVIVNDYQIWRHSSPLSFQCEQLFAVLQVPLKAQGQVIGVIGLGYCEEGRAFGAVETDILSRFAELASIALDNAYLIHSFQRMAYYDALTGLPNRRHLQEALNQELANLGRNGPGGALLFVDMDDLKMINDTMGHSYGDAVIMKAGDYLVGEAGENALVARIGGDEFIVLLPHESSRAKVAAVADNMVKLLSRDYETGDSRTHMSASIGIALYPADGDTAEELFKNADLALYAAKASGKNVWRFYEASLQLNAYENMLLKRDLREAVERGEMSLNYQPLIDARSGKVVSFEALLRWTSAVHGSVPPSRFIPLAEESDIIQKIGKWTIRQACRFARKLAAMGKEDIRVAVNVSPRQLAADDFVAFVCAAINDTGIKPAQLVIEITENILIASMEDSTHKLSELQALGVCLALDDFGTGYSSLTYLRNLPVGTLKIDKSFIDKIVSDEAQFHFISSIINMAHMLRLRVVAEGVETGEQLERLRECKCDLIQGYFFSRPTSEQEAIMFLEQ